LIGHADLPQESRRQALAQKLTLQGDDRHTAMMACHAVVYPEKAGQSKYTSMSSRKPRNRLGGSHRATRR